MMGSFWFLIMVVAFTASPSLSLSTELKLDNPTTAMSAVPALLPEPPELSSPVTELSPDISPLLPSPGGALPSPTGSSIPTIPSTPSPPNPDEVVSLGPGSAASPFGSELTSSSSSLNLFGFLNFAVLMGLVLFW